MLRVSKLADYAVLIMVFLARFNNQSHTAREIASHTSLSLPTVSKILKIMARGGLLISYRGITGGYGLAKVSNEISIAQILELIDGQFGLTECVHDKGMCHLESVCSIKSNWRVINKKIYDALNKLTLSEMAEPIYEVKVKTNETQFR